MVRRQRIDTEHCLLPRVGDKGTCHLSRSLEYHSNSLGKVASQGSGGMPEGEVRNPQRNTLPCFFFGRKRPCLCHAGGRCPLGRPC